MLSKPPLLRTLRAVAPPDSISVVIPVLNEQAQIGGLLDALAPTGAERVVVDGGSQDGTLAAAREHGAERLIESPPGRAAQLDAGWRAATGELILFLHADTRLDPGWDECVRRALADPAAAGGAFRLRFDSASPALRIVELGAHLRARVGGLPYGDQALFTRRRVLEQAGGVPRVPIFEDLDLARSIRRAGRLVLLSERAWTSARRYESAGVTRTVLRNLLALGAYGVRLDRERVARWYRSGARA